MICRNHFETECFARTNKSALRIDAIPTKNGLSPLSNIGKADAVNDNDQIGDEIPSTIEIVNSNDQIGAEISSTIAIVDSNDQIGDEISSTIAIVNSNDRIVLNSHEVSPTIPKDQCKNCRIKDALIEAKDLEIQQMRKQLLKTQKKVWYLETVKRKLGTAFLELKKQSLVNEELSNILEVCNIFIPKIPMAKF